MFVVEAAVKTISLGVVRYITDRYHAYQHHIVHFCSCYSTRCLNVSSRKYLLTRLKIRQQTKNLTNLIRNNGNRHKNRLQCERYVQRYSFNGLVHGQPAYAQLAPER